ncbi:MAG: hypothetical protein GYB65_13020 [Chloroflexi bacterium]|nr:hypothetical protein [Chloroflexota bacterium]
MIKRLCVGLLGVVCLAMLLGPVSSSLPVPVQAGLVAAQSGPVDNCAVTPFDIAGQGRYTISGASGGTVPPGVSRDQIVDPLLRDLQLATNIGREPVAVLVIDDFFEYRDEVAHGRLVTDQLIAMIQGNPIYDFEPRRMYNDPVVWAWEPDGGYGALYVVEVDTENYDTSQLRSRVEDTANLVIDYLGVRRLVLNMSFALIPCETPVYNLRELRAQRVVGETERQTLIAEVGASSRIDVEVRTDARSITSSSLVAEEGTQRTARMLTVYAIDTAEADESGALDPLHDLIRGMTSGTYWSPNREVMVVAVGSAGNFGRNLDSFAPASWPEVISTSAYIGLDTEWEGSNKGQVMLPGGLYPVGDLYVIGTSFSAPVMSMNMAFYLTNSSLCSSPPLDLDLQDFLDPDIVDVVDAGCNPPFIP